MDKQKISDWATILYYADKIKFNVPQITSTDEGFGETDGYLVQHELISRYRTEGAGFCGKKTGGISYGFESKGGFGPHFGYLMEHKMLRSGDTLHLADLLSPGLEAELTVHFSKTIVPGKLDDLTILASIDKVMPSWEIVESRIIRAGKKLQDSLADNAAFGGAVLGAAIETYGREFPPQGVDIYKNGSKIDCLTGCVTSKALCDAIRWLAGRLDTFGERIEAGEYLLSGALTKPLIIPEPGDTYEAVFSDIGSVSISLD